MAACARAREVSASSRADPIAVSRAFMIRVTGRSRSRSSRIDSTRTKPITHTTDKSGSTQRLFPTQDKQQFIPLADEPRQVTVGERASGPCVDERGQRQRSEHLALRPAPQALL